MPSAAPRQTVRWLGNAQAEVERLPARVRSHIGYALELAGLGAIHPDATPLPELGADIHEIRDPHGADIYAVVFRPITGGIVEIVAAFRCEGSSRASARDRLRLVRERLGRGNAHRIGEA